MRSRVAGAGFACIVALGPLAGCGDGGRGDGGEGLPTRSPTISPTRAPPSATRTPIRSDEATGEATDESTRGPTRAPATQPTARETDAGDAQTSEPAEEPAASAEEGQSDDASVPNGAWWLLVAVLLAVGALTWLLVARSRRLGAWQERLQAAEADVAWLARELLPQLRSAGSLDRATGGWQVALPRVAAAEDQLTVLEANAPSQVAGARARALRDAVRQARARMERLASRGPEDVWTLDVDDAIGELESALAREPVASR
jgi:hypothetical protein